MPSLGSEASARSAVRVNWISNRLGSGCCSLWFRLLLIIEPQSSSESGVGDSVFRFGEGRLRGLNIETVLGLLDEALEEFEIFQGNQGRGIPAPPVDDDSLTLVLRSVQYLGERLSKLDHAESHDSDLSQKSDGKARVASLMSIMYMTAPVVNVGSITEGTAGFGNPLPLGDPPSIEVDELVEIDQRKAEIAERVAP
jgi:hypothetical protein